MDKSAWVQLIFWLAALMAIVPRIANLGYAARRWLTSAAFGVLGVGLVWAVVELILWSLG